METANIHHKLILIKVNWSITKRGNLYDATRASWRMSLKRAKRADYVAAVVDKEIKEIYGVDDWFPAKKDNLPWLTEDLPGRIGFSGIIAPQHVRQLYCGKMIPPQFYKKGLANPVLYTYK